MLRKTKSRFLSGKSTIIFNAVLIIMLAFFGACDQEPSISKKVQKEIETLCSESRDGTLTHEIDGVCAKSSIDTYDEYIKDVKITLAEAGYTGNEEKLIRGAMVNRDELYQIIELLNDHPNAVPYIMLANKNDSGVVYTDLIFTIETDTIVGQDTIYRYKYFDFTQPCPNYCPKKYSGLF